MDKRCEGKMMRLVEDEEKAYRRRRRIVSVISIAALIGFFVFVTVVVGRPLLQFISDGDAFRQWVDSHGIWGRLTLVGVMCLQVVIAIIPGEVIEIGAGYAFGMVEGLLLCLVGAALGSAIIFLFTKRFGIKLVEAFISREKIESLKFIRDSKRLDLLTFIVFFIPGTPKDLFTYFIGLTPMKLSTFLIISTVARIPSIVTSAIGGAALGMNNITFAIVVFAITAALSLIGVCIYNRISKRKNS